MASVNLGLSGCSTPTLELSSAKTEETSINTASTPSTPQPPTNASVSSSEVDSLKTEPSLPKPPTLQQVEQRSQSDELAQLLNPTQAHGNITIPLIPPEKRLSNAASAGYSKPSSLDVTQKPNLPTSDSIAEKNTLNVRWNGYCEARGSHYANLKVAQPEQCANACADDPTCQAFTYISGWGRCFLKKNNLGHIRIRFHSGARQSEGLFAPQAYDLDFPGKDLRLVTRIKDWQSCATICIAEPKCLAYGYLEGIASCWIKSGAVSPISKIFFCGFKSTP